MKRLRTLWVLVLALVAGFAVQAQRLSGSMTITNLTVTTINGYNADSVLTNSAAGKLDATNGTAVGLSVSGAFTPSSPAARTFSTDADTLYSLGDSFTFGASATSYTNTYVSKLAASLGLSAINIANGSFSIADANWIIFPGWTVTNSTGPTAHVFASPSAITEDQNWTALIGFNDLRTSSGTGTAPSAARYRLGLDHLLRYVSIPDSAKRWAVSPDASTGTWTPSTWVAYTNKAASSSSGTLTFSNVIGSEIYVGFVAWATNYGGSITVTVDGVAVETRATASTAYGNREYINGTDSVIPDHLGPYGNGKLDFCPHVISATGLGLGAHTVVVTAASNPVTVIWVGGNGWKRTLREGPNVFLGTIPRQSPWTGAGTDALQASYNSQLRSAINTARSAGLRVAWAPVGEYYNPATEQDVDGVHPTNTGHTTIAGAFEQAMAGEMPQMADVGYQTEASQTGSFTTLSVSGTSTLTGNATLGGRLLNLPTAASGGVNSRFGYGSVSASSISLQHSDSSLNQTMNLNGSRIYSTQTTDNNVTNMTVGYVGTTTYLEGTTDIVRKLTAASTFSASSGTENLIALTPTVNQSGTAGFSGIVINPTYTAVGSGAQNPIRVLDNSTNRFLLYRDGGALVQADSAEDWTFKGVSTGASSIYLKFGDTALDRRLELYGNSVRAMVNSTGANANLGLGASGVNVTIQGSASVAQSFVATGAATLNDGVTVSDTFTATSGTENLAALTYTVNQASGTGSSRGLNIAATTTALGSGTHRFISASDDGTDRFYVQTDGRIVVFSPNGTSGMNLRGDSAADSRITLSYAQTLDRHMFINGNGIYVRSADGVTPNNLSLGEAGSNVTIQDTASVAGALTASSTIELGHASDTTLARSAAGVVTIEGVTVAERPTTTALTYSGTNVTLTATSHVLHGNTLTLTNNCLLTITSSDGASGGITIVPHSSTSYTVYLNSAIKLLGGGSSFVVTNSASETVNLEWRQTLRGGSSVILANRAVYP